MRKVTTCICKMMSHFRFVVLLLIGALMCVSAENALTPEEIQILTQNHYTITVNEEDSTITYVHHGIPEHSSNGGWGNRNEAEMVNHSYTVPLKPTVADVKGCAGGLGVIGLAISGGAFYNPYTVFGWDAVEGECAEELDDCLGHPSETGTYHYHGVPECLYTGDLRDKFLGVALDGYPIYGPMDNSSKNWTSAELDECHGHYYNGRYMYRTTYDFPYIISCYHGNSAKRAPEPQSGGPNERARQHAISNEVNRRQVPVPPGSENDPCWNAKYDNWSTEICHVVCKNAGQDLEDCKEEDASTAASTHTSVVLFLTMAYTLRILL